ncbi:MAG: formyltransferase family protein [Candidatus Pacearchaeota archaeon]|nr:formyltransferase family protein [Candidatus Pacearchaeota archaeon]
MILQKLYNPNSNPMRLAIFMSGSGSNARKIIEKYLGRAASPIESGALSFEPVLMFTDNPVSKAHKIANEHGIPVFCSPIRYFYKRRGKDFKDLITRAEYDLQQADVLRSFSIDAVALAGYDWIVTPEICNCFLTINVHPGDLRVRNSEGKRRYTGLAWVPSAKAILNKERMVYTSVHLVTPRLDGGPLLAVSAPQPVPEEALSLERKALLGEADSLKDIRLFLEQNSNLPDEEVARKFPIYRFAKNCQERLKLHGDWVEFPEVIANISLGMYQKDKKGGLYFDGNPIPNGVIRT